MMKFCKRNLEWMNLGTRNNCLDLGDDLKSTIWIRWIGVYYAYRFSSFWCDMLFL